MYLLVVKLLFNGSCCIGTSTVLVFYYFPIIILCRVLFSCLSRAFTDICVSHFPLNVLGRNVIISGGGVWPLPLNCFCCLADFYLAVVLALLSGPLGFVNGNCFYQLVIHSRGMLNCFAFCFQRICQKKSWRVLVLAAIPVWQFCKLVLDICRIRPRWRFTYR